MPASRWLGRVVEATAKDKDIPGRNIRDKIEGLAAGGHISESMREAAHEIRFAGNEAGHGDLVETISVEEAAEVVELMDAILERVYQEPAKVARVRASREARKNREVGHPNRERPRSWMTTQTACG